MSEVLAQCEHQTQRLGQSGRPSRIYSLGRLVGDTVNPATEEPRTLRHQKAIRPRRFPTKYSASTRNVSEKRPFVGSDRQAHKARSPQASSQCPGIEKPYMRISPGFAHATG